MAENLEICPAHSFPDTATLSSLASDRFKISGGCPNSKKELNTLSKINRKPPSMFYTAFPAFPWAFASVLHKKKNPLLHGRHRGNIMVSWKGRLTHFPPCHVVLINRNIHATFLEILYLSCRRNGEAGYEQGGHTGFSFLLCFRRGNEIFLDSIFVASVYSSF